MPFVAILPVLSEAILQAAVSRGDQLHHLQALPDIQHLPEEKAAQDTHLHITDQVDLLAVPFPEAIHPDRPQEVLTAAGVVPQVHHHPLQDLHQDLQEAGDNLNT